MNIIVRREQEDDIKTIAQVVEEAFRNVQHFGNAEHVIVSTLRRRNQLTLSLVALHDGQIIGHLAVSPVKISSGATHWYGLGPISVLPQYQTLGVGTKLMKAAIEQLQKMGAAGCVVVGESAFFGRFGFTKTSDLVMPKVRPEFFRVLPFGDTVPTGTVRFNTAFKMKR